LADSTQEVSILSNSCIQEVSSCNDDSAQEVAILSNSNIPEDSFLEDAVLPHTSAQQSGMQEEFKATPVKGRRGRPPKKSLPEAASVEPAASELPPPSVLSNISKLECSLLEGDYTQVDKVLSNSRIQEEYLSDHSIMAQSSSRKSSTQEEFKNPPVKGRRGRPSKKSQPEATNAIAAAAELPSPSILCNSSLRQGSSFEDDNFEKVTVLNNSNIQDGSSIGDDHTREDTILSNSSTHEDSLFEEAIVALTGAQQTSLQEGFKTPPVKGKRGRPPKKSLPEAATAAAATSVLPLPPKPAEIAVTGKRARKSVNYRELCGETEPETSTPSETGQGDSGDAAAVQPAERARKVRKRKPDAATPAVDHGDGDSVEAEAADAAEIRKKGRKRKSDPSTPASAVACGKCQSEFKNKPSFLYHVASAHAGLVSFM
jgi:hypothetical protein